MIRRLLSIALLLWIGGFVLFAVTLRGGPDPRPTDAIVVLTGGPGRIERGLVLLDAGRAKRMLISGVDRSVRRHELALRYPRARRSFACCIDLGREAVDTRSNAEETADWLRRRGYRSVRLVTTDWHMPRARFELVHMLGGDARAVTVVAEPVESEPGLRALVREYNKYWLRRGAVLAGQLGIVDR